MSRFANLFLTRIGTVVFAALLTFLALNPEGFDRLVRDFSVAEVQGRMSDLVDRVPGDPVTAFGAHLQEGLAARADALRAEIAAGMREITARFIAGFFGDPVAREAGREVYDGTLARYGMAFDQLESMTLERYHAIFGELRRDVTIFAAVSKHLLPLSLMLTITVILSTLWYVLGQDWVLTIIFSNYWGWGYAMLMTVIFLLLVDIALNGARVIRTIADIMGALFDAVRSAAS